MDNGLEVFLLRTLPKKKDFRREPLKLKMVHEASKSMPSIGPFPALVQVKHIHAFLKTENQNHEECWYVATPHKVLQYTDRTHDRLATHAFPATTGPAVVLHMLRVKGLLVLALFNSTLLFCKQKPNHPLEVVGKSACTSKYRVMDSHGDCVGGVLTRLGDAVLYLSITKSLYSTDFSKGFPGEEDLLESNVQVYCTDASSIFCFLNDPKVDSPASSTMIKRSLGKNPFTISCKLEHPEEEATHMFTHRSHLLLVVYNTASKHNAYIFFKKNRLSRNGRLDSQAVEFRHAHNQTRLHVQTVKFVERRNFTLGISVYRSQVVELFAFSPTKQVLGGQFTLTDNMLHDAIVVGQTSKKVWLLVATEGPIPSRLWKIA